MLVTSLLICLAQSAPAAEVSKIITPGQYLTIPSVDLYGRRPFQPDVIYRDHIWKADAKPPEAGEAELGERGEEQFWVAAEANENGGLGGGLGYAYTSLEMKQREVRFAKLAGAWTLYVNGRAYFGDAYRFGFGGVPVVLEKGLNHIFVTGIRGGFSLQFVESDKGVVHGGWDDTVPHLVRGEWTRGAVGIELSNLQDVPTGPIKLEWEGPGIKSSFRYYGGLLGLAANQFAFPLSALVMGEEATIPLQVRVTGPGIEGLSLATHLEFTLDLQVREPSQKRVRTYLSSVDNSAQEYAIVPPSKSDGGGKPEWMGLVLSLHGAGVTSWGQANCYGQRTDFWVVAAMNRRKFGFDWQDWGRRDAYDVLALALRESEVDPRFTYVTGHSMGGHGTWHLAANDLDGFAACAPSAGWESFDSYTGRPEGSLAEVWHAADGSSRTLNLIGNLKQLPTFILHGTNDDNVPATEALSMLEALTKAGGTVEAHFEGGAGHWWGNRCVDWPPFFDFFRKHSIPEDPTHVDFTTVDPSVDADHHWLRVEQPSTYGELLRIHGEWKQEDDSVSLETENVALFRVERTLERAVIDGQSFDLDPESQAHWFRRAADTWSLSESGPSPEEKQAQRSGPLKNAFDKKFLMVVGTGGSAEENAAMLAAAQLHAGSWRYRANGCAKIMTDVDYNFLVAESFAGLQSNVIAYGNHDINLAFRWLRDDCPIDVRRGRVELTRDGESHKVEGEGLGCAFLYPHGASDQHLVGIFAFTGISGARLSSNLQPFKSGAGYPDFTLFNAEILSSGDGGVLETGWFDRDWRLPPAK